MSTSMSLFMAFISLGMVFFFTGCFLAARPASGTTEWINYKCGRKFNFCPAPKPLTKFDIIPLAILLLSAAGIAVLNSIFIPHGNADMSYLAALIDVPLLTIGTCHIYPSHLAFVVLISLLYIFIKNLTDGYLIPLSGVILILLDSFCLLSIGNIAIIFANLFSITAFYLAYRFAVTAKKLYLPFVGIALSIGMVFSASASLAAIGVLVIFVIKEVTLYLADKDKKQTVIRAVLFAVFCLIIPTLIYFTVRSFGFVEVFNIFDTDALLKLPALSLMVSVGGLMALPCCIYQVVNTKDGISLFSIIPFAVYILSAVMFGCKGLLPILAIPVISRSFTALSNRKLNAWIIAYLVTAALFTGSMLIYSLM